MIQNIIAQYKQHYCFKRKLLPPLPSTSLRSIVNAKPCPSFSDGLLSKVGHVNDITPILGKEILCLFTLATSNMQMLVKAGLKYTYF